MKLNGLKIRKAIELEVPVEQIFKIDTIEEGDIAAKEIFEDNINHTSEIENLEEIFGNDSFIFYTSSKKEHKINDNLKAYTYEMYMSHLQEENININSKIINEKSVEVQFLSTKVLNYAEFMQNIMDAQMFLGKYEKCFFRRRFSGIGNFNMEDYVENHSLISFSSLHLLDFFIKDSNIYSTIGQLVTAGYEQDIKDQKEYLTEEEYYRMLDTVKKHKSLIRLGINFNLK
jgi:hypothetical protein